MTKKFAVCFSGYPRFVRKQFDSIKKNILDGLGDYDIYANFQWTDDWKENRYIMSIRISLRLMN